MMEFDEEAQDKEKFRIAMVLHTSKEQKAQTTMQRWCRVIYHQARFNDCAAF